MKESEWRSKLVKTFNSRCAENIYNSMVWVNDVRYKAGWPDLYTVVHGKSTHYELKLIKRRVLQTRIEECMSKLQIAVCNRLTKAGAQVYTLINCPLDNIVVVYNFKTDVYRVKTSHDFDEAWTRGMTID